MPLLGDAYHADKRRSFWGCIWESFTQCQYVVPSDPAAKPENRAMYYKGGPSPPIEISMGRSELKIWLSWISDMDIWVDIYEIINLNRNKKRGNWSTKDE